MKIEKQNTSSYLIPFVEVAAKGISFINILLLVRVFSITEYAQYSYILAVVLWAAVFMDGGINNLIYNKSIQKDLSSINVLFTARIFLSVFVIAILYVLFLLIKRELAFPALLLSITIFFSSSSALIKLFARGNQFVKVDATTIVSEPLIRLISLVLIFLSNSFINWKFWQVLLIYLLASIIAFSINYKSLFKYFELRLTNSKNSSWYQQIYFTLNKSKYYLLYYAMLVGISRVEVIFIEKYGTLEQLSLYSSSLSIFQVAELFFFTIITTQFLALYKKKNKQWMIFILALLLIMMLTQMLSGYFFQYLFPIEYINAQFVLNKMILAIIPCVISFYLITKHNFENRAWVNFIVLSIFLIVKILFYQVEKFSNIEPYAYSFVALQWVIMLGLLIANKIYESTTDQ